MVDLSGIDHKSIIERAKAIILTPKEEWLKIASEETTQNAIFMNYALPLAAIGPVAAFIGGQVFGIGAFGFSYRPGIIAGLTTAIVTFALGLLFLFVVSFIANFLAPKFDGEENKLNAFKLVAYSYTASWLAGIFGLVPMLGIFGLLGIYSIYLMYTGVTPLMKVPQEKAGGYTVVTIVCAAVLGLIAAPITIAITGLFGAGAMSAASAANDGGTLTLPGGKTVDTAKLEQLGKQMENAANGKVPAVDAGKLQALLPASIGSYQRSATETNGANGIGSEANATYTQGSNSYQLRIIDMSALGALAGMGAALGVEHSKSDANGYERTSKVNGQMQTEEWNNSSSNGKFGVMVKDRFMIEADGSAASIDELKAAVAAVDQGSLQSLAP